LSPEKAQEHIDRAERFFALAEDRIGRPG